MRLTPRSHDRDAAGLTYVYPVVSRRARGVSVGINLNPNSACNWRCIYCQVPGLSYGLGPPIDLELLRRELRDMLADLVHGDFMERHVPEPSRRLNDVAFSGSGEPTSSPVFAEAVLVAREVLTELGLLGEIQVVLITNGSLLHKREVQRGLAVLAESNGVVWFKLDSATEAGQRALNGNAAGVERTRTNLRLATELCPTWIQTLVLARGGAPPSPAERSAYLGFLREELARGLRLEGVLLYGLARPSYQPEAPELAALPAEWLESFAAEIRALGLEVRVSP